MREGRRNGSSTPTTFPPESSVWGAWKCQSQAAHGENLGYLYLQKLGLSPAREGCDPAAPSFLEAWLGRVVFIFVFAGQLEDLGKALEGDSTNRPWYSGGTHLVTGPGLVLSLCPTEFTFLGYLRKTPTDQSSWWLQRQITNVYADIVTSFQIKCFKPPKENKITAEF